MTCSSVDELREANLEAELQMQQQRAQHKRQVDKLQTRLLKKVQGATDPEEVRELREEKDHALRAQMVAETKEKEARVKIHDQESELKALREQVKTLESRVSDLRFKAEEGEKA